MCTWLHHCAQTHINCDAVLSIFLFFLHCRRVKNFSKRSYEPKKKPAAVNRHQLIVSLPHIRYILYYVLCAWFGDLLCFTVRLMQINSTGARRLEPVQPVRYSPKWSRWKKSLFLVFSALESIKRSNYRDFVCSLYYLFGNKLFLGIIHTHKHIYCTVRITTNKQTKKKNEIIAIYTKINE